MLLECRALGNFSSVDCNLRQKEVLDIFGVLPVHMEQLVACSRFACNYMVMWTSLKLPQKFYPMIDASAFKVHQ